MEAANPRGHLATKARLCGGALPPRLGIDTDGGRVEHARMCRNIRPLFNFEPPATEQEIRAAALQFVRKVSGYNNPPQANQAAFDEAVDVISEAARELLDKLVSFAPPKNRETEAAKAKARNALRFGPR